MDARDARDARDEPLAINLKVLSPSSEIEGGLHLRDLAASTTVRELRLRIQDAVPSRPGPERMRLIYRGKVVANDADSLEAVFGADNIRESRDQSLHLVLRELPQSASAASTPAPPNPFRPAQPLPASPPLHTNPFRTIPQPRPHSQPQAPHPHPLHPHHTHAHHAHHGQPPLAPLGMPIPPHIQQQLAHALGQTPQQPAAGAAPAEGAPAPQPPVLPPGLAAMPAPPGRTVRQEGIGPNGARWSVTYNDFTANIPLRPGQPTMPRPVPHHAAFAVPPRPFGSPAPGGVNVPLSWLLPRLRGTLQEAAREVDNVRTLLELPTTPEAPGAPSSAGPAFPTWRVDRIREHLRTIAHSLNTVENGLSDPAMQLNMDVIALRQAAGEVRRQANEFSRTIQERAQSTSPSDPLIATAGTAPSDSTSAAAGTASSDSTSAAARTLPSDAPPELFLLSSPQGPVGVLFDQRGTYTTAPFTSTSTSQNFVDHFNQNRQLIAGLGQHIAQSAQNLRNQLGNVQPTPAQPAQPDNPLDHAAAQRVIDRIVQGPNQDQAAPAAPEAPNERVINVAGHLWLIFKLACFVYIFAGGGGWYRPLMLGSIALVVHVVQLGIFEAQFAHMRRHFEALLPNAERLAQGRAQPPDTAHAAHPARLTPEEAARRLLLQRRNGQWGWARDAMRTLERGVALFVASLWPGIGERMVHAQEERERLARVAVTEERERREEEARRAGEADKAEQGEKSEQGEKGEQGEETEKSEHSEHSEKSEQVEKSSEHTNNPHETDPTTTHPVPSASSPHPTPPAPLHRTHTDSLPVHFMDAPLERTKGEGRAADDVEVEQAGQRVKGKESVKGKERAVLLGEGEGAGEAEAEARSEV